MTTTAPGDLLQFRSGIEAVTGIQDATALGITGDRRHQATGGYHLGGSDLVAIGRYHPPAALHVGAASEDYSARYARDREALTDYASAVDVDEHWPIGGRAAWLRWNNLIVGELRTGGGPLHNVVRAVNTCLDGSNDRRFDSTTGFVAEATGDHGHTHIEFWRDTIGALRAPALARLLDLMTEAIKGEAVATHTIDDVFELLAGIVNGQSAPDGVPSAVPDWVGRMAKGADVAAVATALSNLTTTIHDGFVAMQQNQPAIPSAAEVAGEIIKQLGLVPR